MKYKYNELNNIIFIVELNLRLVIMKKNRIDYNGVIGIWVRFLGYMMKIKLGFVIKSCVIKSLKVLFCICYIFFYCNDFVKRINWLFICCSYFCYGGVFGKCYEF